MASAMAEKILRADLRPKGRALSTVQLNANLIPAGT